MNPYKTIFIIAGVVAIASFMIELFPMFNAIANPQEQCMFMPKCNNGHFEVWMTAKSFIGECQKPDFNFNKEQCEEKATVLTK